MIKVIMSLLVAASAVLADGFVVGGDFSYSRVGSELTLSIPGYSESYSDSTKTTGFTARGGYQFDAVRVMGFVTSEKYSDDVVVYNEGNAASVGVEVGYMLDGAFIGVLAAKGSKDFDGTDIDFTDYGVRVGATVELGTDANLEAGVQYKIRGYDSYNYSGVDIDLDEKVLGVFVGVSFNL
jgi:hypothetical protein